MYPAFPRYYAVRVTAINYGNKENTMTKRYLIDRTPPDTPTDVTVEIQERRRTTIMAAQHFEDTDYYEIYREDPDGTFERSAKPGAWYTVTRIWLTERHITT